MKFYVLSFVGTLVYLYCMFLIPTFCWVINEPRILLIVEPEARQGIGRGRNPSGTVPKRKYRYSYLVKYQKENTSIVSTQILDIFSYFSIAANIERQFYL